MKTKASRTYKGHDIWHCDRNASGMKYYAYTSHGRIMADTLQGIKNLITRHE